MASQSSLFESDVKLKLSVALAFAVTKEIRKRKSKNDSNIPMSSSSVLNKEFSPPTGSQSFTQLPSTQMTQSSSQFEFKKPNKIRRISGVDPTQLLPSSQRPEPVMDEECEDFMPASTSELREVVKLFSFLVNLKTQPNTLMTFEKVAEDQECMRQKIMLKFDLAVDKSRGPGHELYSSQLVEIFGLVSKIMTIPLPASWLMLIRNKTETFVRATIDDIFSDKGSSLREKLTYQQQAVRRLIALATGPCDEPFISLFSVLVCQEIVTYAIPSQAFLTSLQADKKAAFIRFENAAFILIGVDGIFNNWLKAIHITSQHVAKNRELFKMIIKYLHSLLNLIDTATQNVYENLSIYNSLLVSLETKIKQVISTIRHFIV
ncbi:hypothetical protein HDE_10389 [Halotydeus destructor]|nr:hypothetical protein HDE_10389 [Halotydeus destructor]